MYSVAQSLDKNTSQMENGVDEAEDVSWHVTASTGRPVLPEQESGILSGNYVAFIVGFTKW